MNSFKRSTLSAACIVATFAFSSAALAEEEEVVPPPAGVSAPNKVLPPPPQTGGEAEPNTPNREVTTINPEDDARADVKTKSWPNRPLLITGLVVLGGSYGASAIVAATSDRKADEKLYYPVVGPWMDLSDRGCDEQPCGSDSFNKVLLVGGGVLQGVGALGVLLSLVIPETTTTEWYLIGNETLHVVPQAGVLNGLTASGRF